MQGVDLQMAVYVRLLRLIPAAMIACGSLVLGMHPGLAQESGPAARSAQNQFSSIYDAEDLQACGGARPGEAGAGISSSDPARDAMAACLVRRWEGGRHWAFATLSVNGRRIANGTAYIAGAPIGFRVEEYYSILNRVLGWTSNGHVTASEGGGQDGPFTAASDRISLNVERTTDGATVFTGSGVTGITLPEGVYKVTVSLDRPATPRGPAGVEKMVRTIVVRDPTNDRRNAYVSIQIDAPPGYGGTGLTLARRRLVSGSPSSGDGAVCRDRVFVSARALRVELIEETDLSSAGRQRELSSYAASWTLKSTGGAIVAQAGSAFTYGLDPTSLPDGDYVLEAALQHGDLPDDSGLRFRPSPASFSVSIRCAEEPIAGVGDEIIGQLLIRRNEAGTNGQPSYATIQTNAERIEPTETRAGGSICRPVTFDAFARFGRVTDAGTPVWGREDERPTALVKWQLLYNGNVLKQGQGRSFGFDPTEIGDGNYRVTATLADAAPRAPNGAAPATAKSVGIYGCGERRPPTAVAERGGNAPAGIDCSVVDCEQLPDGPDELVPHKIIPWLEENARKQEQAHKKSLIPAPRVKPDLNEECVELFKQLERRREQVKQPCDQPRRQMLEVFDTYDDWAKKRDDTIRKLADFLKDDRGILKELSSRIEKLEGRYGRILKQAEERRVLYTHPCKGGSLMIAPGVAWDRLLFKSIDIDNLKSGQSRFRTLADEWDDLLGDKALKRRYDAKIGELNMSIRRDFETVNDYAGIGEELQTKLSDVWWSRTFEHCIGGPPRTETAGGAWPNIPGLGLKFIRLPLPRGLPGFDENKNRLQLFEPLWKIDGRKFASQLRESEEAVADANHHEVRQLFGVLTGGRVGIDTFQTDLYAAANFTKETIFGAGKGIVVGAGQLLKGVVHDIPSYLLFTDQAKFGQDYRALKQTLAGGELVKALEQFSGKAVQGTLGFGAREFVRLYEEGKSFGRRNAQQDIEAFRRFHEANGKVKDALAQGRAATQLWTFLLELGVGGAVESQVNLAGRVGALSKKLTGLSPERTAALKVIQESLSDGTTLRKFQSLVKNRAAKDPERFAAKLKELQQKVSESAKAAARARREAGLVQTVRRKAQSGDPGAVETLRRIEDIEQELTKAGADAHRTIQQADEVRDAVDTLVAEGQLTRLEGDQLKTAVDDSLAQQAGFENADALQRAQGVDNALVDDLADPAGPNTTQVDDVAGTVAPRDFAVGERPEGIQGSTKEGGKIRLETVDENGVPNGEIEWDVQKGGLVTEGKTADIVFIGPEGNQEAVKLSYIKDGVKLELDGAAALESGGLRTVKVVGEGAVVDPNSGKAYQWIKRPKLEEKQLGSYFKKQGRDPNTGKLPLEHQRAVLRYLKDMLDNQVYWGDFKLDNIAFVTDDAGKLQVAALDTAFARGYDDVAKLKPGIKGATDAETAATLRQQQLIQAFDNASGGKYAQDAGVAYGGGGAAGSLHRYIDLDVLKNEFSGLHDELFAPGAATFPKKLEAAFKDVYKPPAKTAAEARKAVETVSKQIKEAGETIDDVVARRSEAIETAAPPGDGVPPVVAPGGSASTTGPSVSPAQETQIPGPGDPGFVSANNGPFAALFRNAPGNGFDNQCPENPL